MDPHLTIDTPRFHQRVAEFPGRLHSLPFYTTALQDICQKHLRQVDLHHHNQKDSDEIRQEWIDSCQADFTRKGIEADMNAILAIADDLDLFQRHSDTFQHTAKPHQIAQRIPDIISPLDNQHLNIPHNQGIHPNGKHKPLDGASTDASTDTPDATATTDTPADKDTTATPAA